MNIFGEVAKRITPYMHSKGFVRSGKSYCCVVNNIAYCIGFDTPSGLLYATAYIMPLFIPCESKYYTYGNRLNANQDIQLPVLDKNDNKATIDNWCNALCEYFEHKIFPFFQQIDSTKKLLEYVDKHPYISSGYIVCHDIYRWRLKMYGYLYMGEYAKATHAIARYRNALSNVAFLSGQVLRKYSDEIDGVEMLIQEGKKATEEYILNVITDTKRLLK